MLTKLKILENVDNIGKYWKNIDERMNEKWTNERMVE